MECAKKVGQFMNNNFLSLSFSVPNPKVAFLYALPKIHKSPLKMRPIASNINTPMEKMAAWLLKKVGKYPINFRKSVSNSIELVDKIKHIQLKRGEILVSFDVKALFPSVPIGKAIDAMKIHLVSSGMPHNEVSACVEIAETCMKQNFFSFRKKFYKQDFGLSMGSKLSPYLANIFMSKMEEDLQKHSLFPRIWFRYVDDVFAVVKERYLNSILTLLNSQCDSIEFTMERENEGSLPFLDLLIKRREDNSIHFAV